MKSWLTLPVRHPLRVLIAAAVLTAVALSGLWRLELRTDGHALVPQHAPEVVTDRSIRERFDVLDPIVIVLEARDPQGIFEPRYLALVAELTGRIQALDGAGGIDPAQVTSLATEKGFRFRPGTLKLRRLLEPLPETADEIETLRRDLERIALYDGVLVAEDGSAAAILVGTPRDGDRVELYRRLVLLTRTHLSSPPTEVAVLGAPVAEALLGHHLLADLGVPEALLGSTAGARPSRHPGMVPLALLVTALILLAAFRRPAPVVLTLALVGQSLLVVFGLMGWLGIPIYLTTAVMPVILTAIGVADAIHLILRFQERRRERPGATSYELVTVTFGELASPVVRTSITTAIGFLSFAVSPLAPVRSFGLLTALGIFVLMASALSVLPALMVLMPDRWLSSAAGRAARWPAALAARVQEHRVGVLLAALVVVVVAADGVRRLRVDDSWLDGFSPRSAFARSTARFEERFLGAHQLLLSVRFDSWRAAGQVPGAWIGHDRLFLPGLDAPGMTSLPRDPARIAGSWIRVAQHQPRPGAERARDWTAAVASARFESDGIESGGIESDASSRLLLTLPPRSGSPRFWLKPDPEERIDFELWAEPLMMPEQLERLQALEAFLETRPGVGGVLGPARYLETAAFMIQPENPEARRLPETAREARILWHNLASVRGRERVERLRSPELDEVLISVYLKRSSYGATAGLIDALRDYEDHRLRPHGIRLELAGDVAVSQALIEAVVRTQVGSLLISLLGILLVAGVLRWGLLCVLPPAIAVWLDFALMGWLDIPLGVATSMFAGMTLGVGVDYAIHLLSRHRRALAAGLDRPAAVADALTATGPAVVLNALAVGLGFGVLLLSQVPGNARLGGLLLASVLHCLIATLLLIPAWLAFEKG